jgi:heat shock protein 4
MLPQRFVGCHAQDKVSSAPKNTITKLKRLIGRDFNEPEVQEFIKTVPYQVEEGENGKPVFAVQYMGERRTFNVEQLLAMLMKELKFQAENDHGGTVTDCVVSVPCYFTEMQRRAVRDAASIAEFNCLRLLSEPTAVSLSYGLYQPELPAEGEVPRYVTFVDVGHSATQVCVTAFNKGKLRVLSMGWDRAVGGEALDKKLLDHFVDDFKQRYKIDVRESQKSMNRLSAQLEKSIKKILSVNPESSTSIECLKDDVDVSLKLSREDFEKMVEPIAEQFMGPVKKAVEDSGVSLQDMHSIEVVGNSSRVPAFLSRLEEYFGKATSRTMNASECIARGCAISSAMHSPQFVVKNFDVQDAQPFPITFSWKDEENGELKEQLLFPRTNPVPSSKILNFKRSQAFSVNVRYSDPSDEQAIDRMLPDSHPRNIAQYNIAAPTSDGTKTSVKLKANLTLDGIVDVPSVLAIEQKEEDGSTEEQQQQQQQQQQHQQDQEMSGSGDRNGEQQHEQEQQQGNSEEQQQQSQSHSEKKVRKVKRELSVDSTLSKLSQEQINHFYQEEFNMAAQDRVQEETKQKKNDLEEYAITMRSKLMDDLVQYVVQDENERLRKLCDEMEDWLYDEEGGEDASRGEYVEKLEQLKKQIEPVRERYEEERTRQPSADELQTAVNTYLAKLEQEDYAHISDEDKGKISNECSNVQGWLSDKLHMQSQTPKTQAPAVLTSEIKKKMKTLQRFVDPLLNQPKPSQQNQNENQNQQQQSKEGGEEQQENDGEEQQQQYEESKPEDMETDKSGNVADDDGAHAHNMDVDGGGDN